MEVVQLSGSLRANVGKKATKAVRNSGQVPCVLYGSGEQTCFSVRDVSIEKLIFNPNVYQIELDIDGVKKMAIIKDKQMHPLTDKPLHVDFLELFDDKEVRMEIPINVVGRAKGVLNGGNLATIFRTLYVQALPKDIPNAVEIDVTPLRIGQGLYVRDLDVPGVTVLDNPNAIITAVRMARGAMDEDEEEEEEGAEEGAATEEAATEE